MQASPPGEPIVRGARRNVVVSVDTRLFESFSVRLRVAAEGSAVAARSAVGWVNFAAAVADEHESDLLFEGIHVGDVRQSNAAAAEDANMGKLVEVRQAAGSSLHTAHRQTGHGSIRLLSKG